MSSSAAAVKLKVRAAVSKARKAVSDGGSQAGKKLRFLPVLFDSPHTRYRRSFKAVLWAPAGTHAAARRIGRCCRRRPFGDPHRQLARGSTWVRSASHTNSFRPRRASSILTLVADRALRLIEFFGRCDEAQGLNGGLTGLPRRSAMVEPQVDTIINFLHSSSSIRS